jgi:hypothetical protein
MAGRRYILNKGEAMRINMVSPMGVSAGLGSSLKLIFGICVVAGFSMVRRGAHILFFAGSGYSIVDGRRWRRFGDN